MALLHRSTFEAAYGVNVDTLTPEVGSPLIFDGQSYQSIVNNNRATTYNDYTSMRTNDTFATANYVVRGIARRVGDTGDPVQSVGIYGRINGTLPTTYLQLLAGVSNIQMYKRVGGAAPQLLGTYSWSPSLNVDYDLELVCSGTSVWARLGGVVVIAPVTVTDVTVAGYAQYDLSHQNRADWVNTGWNLDTFEVNDTIPALPEPASTSTTPNTRQGAILANSTGVTRYHYLQTTAGEPATGLTNATSGLTACYVRDGAASTAVTLAGGTANGAWGSGKFAEVDATHCPGLYRVDWPNAAFVSGTSEAVALVVKGTGLRPSEEVVPLALDLTLWGGEVTTGATPTLLPTAGLPTLTAGQLNRRLLQFTGGPCMDERVLIVGQSSGGSLQVAPPLTVAPSDGDPFVIL